MILERCYKTSARQTGACGRNHRLTGGGGRGGTTGGNPTVGHAQREDAAQQSRRSFQNSGTIRGSPGAHHLPAGDFPTLHTQTSPTQDRQVNTQHTVMSSYLLYYHPMSSHPLFMS